MAKCATCGTTIFGGLKEKGQVFCNSTCSSQYQDSVICGKCGTENPLDEKKCSECSEYLHQFKNVATGSAPALKQKKKGGFLSGCVTIFVGLFLLVVIANIVNPQGRQSTNSDSQPNQQSANNQTNDAVEIEDNGLTGPQKNAVRSAKNYLSISGFSRDGLIQQLSSKAGDGYDISDATKAVDSLNNDWKQEAVKSAKNYLSISGFSCQGLIEQLSSSAGDKYTVEQATYGAQQAGACN